MRISNRFVSELIISLLFMLCLPTSAEATDCYESTIVTPSPFMGNNDEIFKLADGTIWQVKYEYEYLYEYLPNVVICPSRGVLVINGKTLNVVPIRSGGTGGVPANALAVVYRPRGCDYFVAQGPQGYYILQWYGGFDPVKGDTLIGYQQGYGFKDVVYLPDGSAGRVWVEDYWLTRDRAAKKIATKCR